MKDKTTSYLYKIITYLFAVLTLASAGVAFMTFVDRPSTGFGIFLILIPPLLICWVSALKSSYYLRCPECAQTYKLTDLTRTESWTSGGYAHTKKDGSADKRYKNNSYSARQHERHRCPSCKKESSPIVVHPGFGRKLRAYDHGKNKLRWWNEADRLQKEIEDQLIDQHGSLDKVPPSLRRFYLDRD